MKQLSKKFGMDYKRLLPVVAATIGDMGLLSEFYSDIKEKLGINSESSVRYIMQLANG